MSKITEIEHTNRCQQLLNLTYEGKYLKDIAIEMKLSIPMLTIIKRSDEYKELDYQRRTEIRAIQEMRRQKTIERLASMREGVLNQLEDLSKSENEKISIDACKFLMTHIDKLENDSNEKTLQAITDGLDIIMKEKLYPN